MTTGRDPVDRNDRHVTDDRDARRKLAMMLAALAVLLAVILFIFFYWWNEEGEQTDPEDVTRLTLVSESHAFYQEALAWAS